MRCFVVLMALVSARAIHCADQDTLFKVVGYLPDYRFGLSLDRLTRSLTHLVLFSIEPTPKGGIDGSRIPRSLLSEAAMSGQRNHCKVYVSVGGAGRSGNFASATSKEKRRDKLAMTLAAFVQQHHLDGIDLNWEAPITAQEKLDQDRFVEALAGLLHPLGRELSVAVHMGSHITPSIAKHADALHVMAYDAPLQVGANHASLQLVQGGVKGLGVQGIPAHKIVMGVPLYGRGLTNPGNVLTYAQLVAQFGPLDPSLDEIGGYGFNGKATVRAKTLWGIEAGIGGVMVWEVGQDTQDISTSLVATIADAAAGATIRGGWGDSSPNIDHKGPKEPHPGLSGGIGGVVLLALALAAILHCSTRAKAVKRKARKSP